MLITDKRTHKRTKLHTKECPICTIKFGTYRVDRITCSKKCKSKLSSSINSKPKEFTCKLCNSPFRTTYRNGRQRTFYCSSKCKLLTKKLLLPKGEYYSTDGYIVISKLPDGRVQIKKHRYIMECEIGRRLLPTEIVHHRDENKLNNTVDNLQIVSRAEHNKIHFSKNQTEVHY